MQSIAENLWLLRYPQSLLGARIGRTVTVIRLRSDEVLIHSTAPFTTADVQAIRAVGVPAFLTDVTLFHDTFAKEGRRAFPNVPYAAPAGFVLATASMTALAEKWPSELVVIELAGIPKLREHAVLHRPTRTLIVADLVFNFGPSASAWTRGFFRWAGGIREFPGMSRLFRHSIRDRRAFAASIEQLLNQDFDRLIVGHGDVIETGAKEQLIGALDKHGLCSARI